MVSSCTWGAWSACFCQMACTCSVRTTSGDSKAGCLLPLRDFICSLWARFLRRS